jgi:hypothetical protein
VEEGQQGMVVDKGVGDNKGFLHMPTDIEVCHTLVIVGVVVVVRGVTNQSVC